MKRRTKIVATLGPSTDAPGVLEKIIKAGVNVVRMNFSHGSPEDHKLRVTQVRELAKKYKRSVAILGDLQGPKIRVARFAEGPIQLAVGDVFCLDSSLARDAGNQNEVGLDYAHLPDDVVPEDRLLLDDGRVVLRVTAIDGTRISTEVEVGGKLSNNKGINKQGGGLSADALTEKDFRDIRLAAELEVDYLAVSFVRSGEDLEKARALLREAGGDAGLIAKVERAEAVQPEILDGIIRASDGVMVARGDLGVEIGDAELIAVQKHMIARAEELNKPVITATQMMESMIDSPLPTRAEVFDVANAVLDGTDAVMLSGETAAGQFPLEVVDAMNRVIIGAERQPQTKISTHRLHEHFATIDEAIALATMYTANHLDGVKAIISFTETGRTPLYMTRISSGLPVYAFTDHARTEQRLALYRGVEPVTFDTGKHQPEDLNQAVVNELLSRGVVAEGDLVIISKGDFRNVHGGTNTMKIVRVGDAIH
ncbi:MAG: pyruvate kinase [Gammaproteobacteria bacterium]|uniref:pyruvate kinase n=1 Tax=Pseudomaricurvus alcaniphilus TaxID=1166482 RepID=UPI00140760B9|nr:pyruvate kinase [Pseudomaricurvus alcaniphilus]MBR9912453.1 pyruvate kinase [Gammaproteobacteria bacterium]NHN37394.1 pyruvate kinase [Pseudomaricurvus alcaniphilus]